MSREYHFIAKGSIDIELIKRERRKAQKTNSYPLMIVIDLGYIIEQIALAPMIVKVITFRQQTPVQELGDGRIEIDGNRVYAVVQTYETLIIDAPRFEAHRKYNHIQYITSGLEFIAWAPTELLQSPTAYDESSDT